MTYSLDFRLTALKVKKKEKLTFEQTAQRFCVGVSTLVRWSKKIASVKTRCKPATKIDIEALKKDIETHPDAFQYERAQRLGVTQMGIWHALKRLKITYKKNSESSQSGPRRKVYILPEDIEI